MLKMLNLKEEIIGITVWNKNRIFLFPSIICFASLQLSRIMLSFFLLGFKVRGVASLTDIWMLRVVQLNHKLCVPVLIGTSILFVFYLALMV